MHTIIQIIIGVFIADFLVAFFHWIEDTYFSYCMKLPIFQGVIRKIAQDNDMHHYYPREMLTCSYLVTISVSLPVAFLVCGMIYAISPAIFYNYKYMILSIFVVGSLGNIFHRWSHLRDCELSWFGRIAYSTGLFVDHKHHTVHHAKKPSLRYGVVLTPTNYVLDTCKFWRGLEIIIQSLTGLKPKPKQPYHELVENIAETHIHKSTKISICPKVITDKEAGQLFALLDSHFGCLKEK